MRVRILLKSTSVVGLSSVGQFMKFSLHFTMRMILKLVIESWPTSFSKLFINIQHHLFANETNISVADGYIEKIEACCK